MTDRFPSQLAEKIVVRCPDGLRDRLAERAKANGRSANAEAVMALEAWLSHPAEAAPPAHVLPRTLENRFRMIVGEAVNAALSDPDLLRRYGELEEAKRMRNEEVRLSDENGRTFTQGDLLSSAGDVEQGPGIWPPLIEGAPPSPEEQAKRMRERRGEDLPSEPSKPTKRKVKF